MICHVDANVGCGICGMSWGLVRGVLLETIANATQRTAIIDIKTGWWFATCFIFHIGNNNPMWLIFFRLVGQPPTRRWWWKYVVALSENGVPHSIHWLIISFPIQPAGKPFQTTRIKSWMSKLGTAGAIPCPSFSPWSSLARWASHGYAWDLLEGEVNHLRRCQNFKTTRTSYVVPICTLCFWICQVCEHENWGGATFDWVNIQPHQLWDRHGSVWKWGWEYLKTAAKHGESDDHNRDIMVVQRGTK